MKRKSISSSLLIIFLSILFATIGTCFSVFAYQKTKIEVSEVKVVSVDGIDVFDDEELTKKSSRLILSKMELGLKPATGEIDSESQIPSTINDKGTSEGYYSTVFVRTNLGIKISVVDVIVEGGQDDISANEERENIFVSIKDIRGTTKSLENETTKLVELTNINGTQKLTFFIWLGALADDVLEGAKISFTIKFEQI